MYKSLPESSSVMIVVRVVANAHIALMDMYQNEKRKRKRNTFAYMNHVSIVYLSRPLVCT